VDIVLGLRGLPGIEGVGSKANHRPGNIPRPLESAASIPLCTSVASLLLAPQVVPSPEFHFRGEKNMKRLAALLGATAIALLATACNQSANTHDADVQALKDNEIQWNAD